jgi:AcrR family transcriptional regulator
MARKGIPHVTYKRADRPEQKDERRQLILSAAAAELALISSAEDFTISALARRAGLAKGTVYLYFKSKSAILMELLGEAVENLVTDMKERLINLPEPATAASVAGAISDCLKNSATSRRLVRLLKSLSDEDFGQSHQKFQKRIHPLIEQLDEILVRRMPTLRAEDGKQILIYSWALLLGLSEMAERRANHLKKPAPPKVEERLSEGLTLLIEGYLARSRNG